MADLSTKRILQGEHYFTLKIRLLTKIYVVIQLIFPMLIHKIQYVGYLHVF